MNKRFIIPNMYVHWFNLSIPIEIIAPMWVYWCSIRYREVYLYGLVLMPLVMFLDPLWRVLPIDFFIFLFFTSYCLNSFSFFFFLNSLCCVYVSSCCIRSLFHVPLFPCFVSSTKLVLLTCLNTLICKKLYYWFLRGSWWQQRLWWTPKWTWRRRTRWHLCNPRYQDWCKRIRSCTLPCSHNTRCCFGSEPIHPRARRWTEVHRSRVLRWFQKIRCSMGWLGLGGDTSEVVK